MNCLSKILDACIVERRGNSEKVFYVRRILGLWIATLTTLQTV